MLCGQQTVQVPPRGSGTTKLDLDALADRLAESVTEVERTPQMLRFSAESCRFSVFADGRALVRGTDDLDRARVLYDRYVGL